MYINSFEFGFQTDRKKEVFQVLENNLKEGLETIGQSMDEAYEAFERCLSEGVRQSVETCEKIAKDKVIEPVSHKCTHIEDMSTHNRLSC